MSIGIYRISSPSGNCYIGSSIATERRFYSHKSDMRRGGRGNKALQAAFRKYGDALVFEVIFSVFSVKDLPEFEQHFIDELRPQYNGTRFVRAAMLDPEVAKRMGNTAKHSMAHIAARKKNQALAAQAVSRPVIRVSDGKIFKSGYDAARSCNANGRPDNIFTAIRKGWKFGGVFWAYADSPKVLEELESAARRKKILRKFHATERMIETQRKPVFDVTKGRAFYSISEAARHMGVSHGAIDRALRTGSKCCGSEWEYA